eukprot:PhM_4_TR7928/c0_g1_i1/m.102952
MILLLTESEVGVLCVHKGLETRRRSDCGRAAPTTTTTTTTTNNTWYATRICIICTARHGWAHGGARPHCRAAAFAYYSHDHAETVQSVATASARQKTHIRDRALTGRCRCGRLSTLHRCSTGCLDLPLPLCGDPRELEHGLLPHDVRDTACTLRHRRHPHGARPEDTCGDLTNADWGRVERAVFRRGCAVDGVSDLHGALLGHGAAVPHRSLAGAITTFGRHFDLRPCGCQVEVHAGHRGAHVVPGAHPDGPHDHSAAHVQMKGTDVLDATGGGVRAVRREHNDPGDGRVTALVVADDHTQPVGVRAAGWVDRRRGNVARW